MDGSRDDHTKWNKSETNQFSSDKSVQFSRSVCLIICDPMNRSTPGLLSITISQSLPILMSIESMMPSDHLIFCCPLLLLPSIFRNISIFSDESALRIRWPKYWSFSSNVSPSNEHPGCSGLLLWFIRLSLCSMVFFSMLKNSRIISWNSLSISSEKTQVAPFRLFWMPYQGKKWVFCLNFLKLYFWTYF